MVTHRADQVKAKAKDLAADHRHLVLAKMVVAVVTAVALLAIHKIILKATVDRDKDKDKDKADRDNLEDKAEMVALPAIHQADRADKYQVWYFISSKKKAMNYNK